MFDSAGAANNMANSEINPLVRKFDPQVASGEAGPDEVEVRKDFPESWIYEDLNDLGLVA